MLKSDLCDNCDECIVIKGTITAEGGNNSKKEMTITLKKK